MKKYFMFVAVAAAGMLASCSSDSLTAGSDPKIEPTQDERVPIEIGVASTQTKASTRGIGTVGDVAGGANQWRGEKVNVFMFDKGTLNLALEDPDNAATALYDNVPLTTPNDGSASGKAKEYYDSDLDGTDDREKFKYYPVTGNFDFWGYYADDRGGAPVRDVAAPNTTEITVPFTNLDGTQDLMVAKAVPTAADISLLGTRSSDYYSAYAARKTVQPDMTFKHLLTRLTFSVLAGDDATRGFTAAGPALPADGNTYTGVFIKSIKVESLKDGEMIVAYTGDDRALTDLISFTETTPAAPADSAWFNLKSSTRNATGLDPLYDPAVFEIAPVLSTDPSPWTTEYLQTNKLLLIDETTGTYNTHWSEIWRPDDKTTPKTIGGAVIVAPANKYYIEVVLGQYLLDNDNLAGTDPVYKVAYTTIKREITPTSGTAFEQGYSYNVKMTLYGFEMIDIITTLEAWQSGTDVEFTVD